MSWLGSSTTYLIGGHQWDVMEQYLSESFDPFAEWHSTSEFGATLMPLNRRFWEFCNSENDGLFRYWFAYAHKHPEHVVP